MFIHPRYKGNAFRIWFCFKEFVVECLQHNVWLTKLISLFNLSLFCSNKVTQLTSENGALKTLKKKLMEEVHKLKGSEDNSKLKNDSSRRLPEGNRQQNVPYSLDLLEK